MRKPPKTAAARVKREVNEAHEANKAFEAHKACEMINTIS